MIAFLPNRKLLTGLYLPRPEQIPAGELRCLVFDFPAVAAMEVQEQSILLDEPFVIWATTGFSDQAAGFRLQLYHDHQGKQRAWFNKPGIASNVVGNGQRPAILKETYPIDAGDSLLAEVRSLAAAQARMQIALYGVVPR